MKRKLFDITLSTAATGAAVANKFTGTKLFSSASVTVASAGDSAKLKVKVASDAKAGNYTSQSMQFTDGSVMIAFDIEISDNRIPTGSKITGFVDSVDMPEWIPTGDSMNEAGQSSILPITADMFTWKDSKGDVVSYESHHSMRASHLKDIGVRRVYQKGTANTIRDVELRTSDFDVRTRTVKFYPLTKETDVELKIALTYKGSTKNAPEYEYNFTVNNEEEIIEEGQTEASSFGNIYLKADATVRNVEFQGDDDEIVFATKTVVKGQKYYFNVTSELEKEDEQIIADNPEVDSIYNVYQSNMANATVQFKNLDREFFVYDGEGKLLGTTKDTKLPLSKKYILTTAKVDFGGEEEPTEPTEEPSEPTEPDAPPMGGGEVTAPSNNYNPNTGL